MKAKHVVQVLTGILGIVLLATSVGSAAAMLSREMVSAEMPETVVLSISEAGRYSLQVKSPSGASLQMVDIIKGPGPVVGVPGGIDGRLDVFLDAGDYLLVVTGAGHLDETVSITARPFTDVSHHDARLPGTDPYETSLNDLQAVDFQFTVTDDRMIYIDAAGRALQDMRLWIDGTWLSGYEPQESRMDNNPERPMNRRRLMVRCPSGTHRVTLYGGEPVDWAHGGDDMPLYIRSGIPSVSSAGSINRNVSVFGEDIYMTASGTDYIRLDSLVQGTGLSVRDIHDESDIPLNEYYPRVVYDNNRPWVEYTTYSSETSKIVIVTGRPGTQYKLKWFTTAHRNPQTVYYDGTYDVTFFHGGSPGDLPELNVIIIEENRRAPFQEQVMAFSTVDAGPGLPVLRRFNVSDPVTLYVRFLEAGSYRLSARGAAGRFVLESFFVRQPRDYIRPVPQSFPSTVHAGAYIHKLTFEPDAPGLVELAITPENIEPDWSQLPFVPTADEDVVRFPELTFTNQKQYQFFTNDLNVRTGVFRGQPTLTDTPVQAAFQPQGADMPGTRRRTGAAIPLLEPGKHILLEIREGISSRARIEVSRDGVYEIAAKSRYPVQAALRGALRTDLGGYAVAGTGNHSVIRQYLKAGEYFVDISGASGAPGVATVSCSLLEDVFMGLIEPGQICRTDIGEQRVASAELSIVKKAEYCMETKIPGVSAMLRLENDRGWPLAVETDVIHGVTLQPGRYRLIQLAPAYTRHGRIVTDLCETPVPMSWDEPEGMDLTKPAQGFWMERDAASLGDIRTFELQAETLLTVRYSPGMAGRIVDVITGDPVAIVPENMPWSGVMQAGEWALVTVSALPDNMKPYTVHVTADPLVGGTSAAITAPGKTDCRIGGLEPRFAIISIDGDADTRAVLTDSHGRILASSDDIRGDWNPYFAMWLEPGDYRVFVTPVGTAPVNVSVTMHLPHIRTVKWPESNVLTVEPYRDAVWLETGGPADSVMAVSVTSNGLSGIASVPVTGKTHVGSVSLPNREHLYYPAPGSDAGCIVWSVDGRYDPVTLTRTHLSLTPQPFQGETHSVRWTTTDGLPGIHVASAAVVLASPGSYTVNTGSDQTSSLVVSTDNASFRSIPSTVSSLAAQETILLAQSYRSGERPVSATLNRTVMGENTDVVEWVIDRNDTVWTDIRLQESDNAVVLITSDFQGLQVGHNDQWLASPDPDSSNGSQNIRYHVLKNGNIHRLGFRPVDTDSADISTDAAMSGQGRISARLYTFDTGDAVHLNGQAGSFQLSANTMLVLSSAPNMETFAAEGVVTVFDADTGQHRFYNLNNRHAGIAWRPEDEMVVLPGTIKAEHGEGREVFLGPGFTQVYGLSLKDACHTGIFVQSNSGYINARLRDQYGMDLMSGLLINGYLEAGEYTLEITNPGVRPSAVVQPFFVLKTPENLMRFGMED